MRRVYFVVEGQTESEFVEQVLAPYFLEYGIYDVRAILIETSPGHKGGFVKYGHLKKLVTRLLKQEPDVAITTFVDYFRIPSSMPGYSDCMSRPQVSQKIICLEQQLKNDILTEIERHFFIPYIQQYEFEALLFSANDGFEALWDAAVFNATNDIIRQFPNPEEINHGPDTAPSKRLLNIIPGYEKIIDGNMIAMEIGIDAILEKCPRFRAWVEKLIEMARD
ncbi:MAG TPA: DUF4276 family protein [Flavilitoribacter sp.]|nr:DUF4276 family protein [Flavilitoribacter sp.]HMQ87607.1 DUF4276 family protein [Flavilitoribacter sp.]